MMNRINCQLNKIPIAKKIVILYGSLFTLTIIAISAVLLITAKGMGVGITITALQNCSDTIESYVLSGKNITKESIETIIGSSYADYIIENKTEGEVYLNVNAYGDDIETDMPINRDELPENIEEEFDFHKKEADSGYIRIPDDSDYTIYTKNGHDFICVQNEFTYDGDVYSVKLFKASLDNIFYVKYIAMRLLYIDIVGFLFAGLIGIYISHTMLKPVRKIRETAERISVEDLSQRIEISGPDDDLKELSITFNSMIDRLERSFEQQSRFVSDASHELRTPISVIKGYANLINRWGKDDPEILQEAVNNILEETDHMSVMIKNLLFLARSDQHRAHIQKQPMSLNDAVRDIAKDLSVTDEKINIITDICDKDMVIDGDPDLIKQMLWIYTENAVKYSGQEKTITYRVFSEGQYACVSVKDNGCGINKEDLPHIFERFYRVDKSRNKNIPGTGLGLSIAEWIIDVHSGSVEVNSVVGQGTEFISKFKVE
mgnify:FL=1